ncbi:MAG: ATP-binding cassette domain-containing protein [Candidatus Pacebacteria bacterium]|nr:ATP-binding cassette domain-containing protein [Candidatus Paceibacterota bacterium]
METFLKVQNLVKEYKNGFRAVDDVSFEVGAGEIFGLLGPNGAGKTTIIRAISTILSFTNGKIEVLGKDNLRYAEEVRSNIGVLTTDIGAYERFTGKENLQYFGELYGLSSSDLDKRIKELTELLDMGGFIDKKAAKYSTGMKQRLAIARSVIHDPKVIIFDEPTSGLDVLSSQTVRDFMSHARESGRAVIFSTHQMYDAEKLCDRVIIIHKGKEIAYDSVENLKTQTGERDLEDVFLKLVKGEGV